MQFFLIFRIFLFFVCLFAYPAQSYAALSDISITEIFYDADGADTDKEWIEIMNGGMDVVTVQTGLNDESLRVYEEHGAVKHNHALTAEPYQGDLLFAPGEFAVIAQNGDVFKSLFPSYSGTIIVSSAMSLTNTSQVIGLKIGSHGSVWSSVTYSNSQGANGDGKSLQLQNGQWITAAPTPGDTQSNASAGGSETETASSRAVVTEPSKNLASTVSIPKFTVFAGNDETAIAGAEVSFFGRALGFDNQPLNGGRFLWNFGDGSVAEGRAVSHMFHFPGRYTASLTVSSGYEAASDYMLITVISNPIFISEIKTGADGFIELANDSKEMLDIGGFVLKSEISKKEFLVPFGTKISAGSAVAFPDNTTGIAVLNSYDEIALFYPNRMLVSRVILKGTPQGEAVFTATKDGMVNIASASTPGSFVPPQASFKKTNVVLPESGQSATAKKQSVAKIEPVKISLPSENPTDFKEKIQPVNYKENARSVINEYAFSGFSGAMPLGAAVAVSFIAAVAFFIIKKYFL